VAAVIKEKIIVGGILSMSVEYPDNSNVHFAQGVLPTTVL